MQQPRAVSVRRLCWSISIQFVAIHSSAAENRKKTPKKPYFGGSRSFKVIDVDTTKSTSVVCLLWQAACLCLSATILKLDKAIAKKWQIF